MDPLGLTLLPPESDMVGETEVVWGTPSRSRPPGTQVERRNPDTGHPCPVRVGEGAMSGRCKGNGRGGSTKGPTPSLPGSTPTYLYVRGRVAVCVCLSPYPLVSWSSSSSTSVLKSCLWSFLKESVVPGFLPPPDLLHPPTS